MNADLDQLLNKHLPGRVVRKDLTKKVKEGANVPVYVLEYLLGQYCASDDDAIITDGLKTVKNILNTVKNSLNTVRNSLNLENIQEVVAEEWELLLAL